MRGHHIYCRSWFKYGSNVKNAGTYTIELSPEDILGANSDDVLMKRVEPLCATVPEALAPRDSGVNILRLYHPAPDTSIVSRSWYVNDIITGRGTVPYTFSLIFSATDNENFMKFPVTAFTIDAFEPYKSFAGRVSDDAPAKPFAKYDPKAEDYTAPHTSGGDVWGNIFNKNKFTDFYVSLCKAVCSNKSNEKVAVILPKNADGERFILAVFTLLPVFIKKRFGAASAWTGLMDGSGSTAVNGLQLLCYRDELPASEAKYPVIDLSGNYNLPPFNITRQEAELAAWVWDNIENKSELDKFENFLNDNFTEVLEKMPFEVIAIAYDMWQNFTVNRGNMQNPPLALAAEMLVTIAAKFTKNFAKFEFIKTVLDSCVKKISADAAGGADTSEITVEVIRKICVLASNGAETRDLLDNLYKRLYNDKSWDKLAVVLTYYASVLSDPNSSGKMESYICNVFLECLNCGERDCEGIAQDSIAKFCIRKRQIALSVANNSTEPLEKYIEYSSVLFSINKLSAQLFFLPESVSKETQAIENFYELEKFDIKRLDYIPDAAHWKTAVNWAAKLDAERQGVLYKLYFEKIAEKFAFLETLEKLNYAHFLIRGENSKIAAVLELYIQAFLRGLSGAIESAGFWAYVQSWLERFDRLELTSYGVRAVMKERIALSTGTLRKLAAIAPPETISTIKTLYDKDGEITEGSDLCSRIDAVKNGRDSYGAIVSELNDHSIQNWELCIRRLTYWNNLSQGADFELALAIAFAIQAGTYGEKNLIAETFLKICRGEREQSDVKDLTAIFSAVAVINRNEEYSDVYRNEIFNALNSEISNISENSAFTAESVKGAFKRIRNCENKAELCDTITEKLRSDSAISDEFKRLYRPEGQIYAAQNSESDNSTAWLNVVISAIFIISAALCFALFGIPAAIGAGGVYVPAVSALVFASVISGAVAVLITREE
ncbi:MAG: hypothetical protein LBM98_01075 [Oscillospiraceae bacterium]|jgi:hypothetical protein|nr:hypothetical protein [Oscillospiraceae bacterium]